MFHPSYIPLPPPPRLLPSELDARDTGTHVVDLLRYEEQDIPGCRKWM